tara:strand:+ start:1119 stop:1343 length:225 start_codon:yes stop_codon:yes gene_type:complete
MTLDTPLLKPSPRDVAMRTLVLLEASLSDARSLAQRVDIERAKRQIQAVIRTIDIADTLARERAINRQAQFMSG